MTELTPEQVRVQRRAADAARAAERLAQALAGGDRLDPVAVAYVERLRAATATVEDRTEWDRENTAPAPGYMRRLQHSMQTTAERHL